MDMGYKTVTGPLKLWPCGISSKETPERAEKWWLLVLTQLEVTVDFYSPSKAYDIA